MARCLCQLSPVTLSRFEGDGALSGVSKMRWIMVSLVALGLTSSLGQAQSIPEDVSQLKEDVRRVMERLERLEAGNLPSPGSGTSPTMSQGQIAVFNPSGTPVVVIKPDQLGHGHVQVGDFELGTRHGVEAGAVVAYDSNAGGLVPASTVNAKQVVGVVSGAGGVSPGMVIGSRKDGSRDFPVSMSGVIYVGVSGEAGPIEPGDLLVPSSVAGVGMRARDHLSAAGMVFGKALEPWSKAGEGLVLMLVMNR